MRPYFLGVDGGGTKTCFVLADQHGTVLKEFTGGSGYYLQTGMEGLRDLLRDGIDRVCDDFDQIEHAFFGLPSFGEDSVNDKLLVDLPRDILGHDRYLCDNDMVCGWAGSMGCEDGINIVAGTGSIAYGQRQGKSARAGGWGELFSDEGSAHWLAVQTLNAFTRMCDGRLKPGPLRRILREHLSLESDLDICARILNVSSTRADLAEYSQLTTRAAKLGDDVAIALFDHAAQELAALIGAVADSLAFDQAEQIPVSYSGGMFNAGELLLAPFKEHLRRRSDKFTLVQPLNPPKIGAVMYAIEAQVRQKASNA